MQKAEAQHSQQNQTAARQPNGAALESPQSERISQLETMADTSPQTGRLSQLAAMAGTSPVGLAQRRMMDMIYNSPRMAAQLKVADAIHNSPHLAAQRQKLDTLTRETAQREETEEPLQPKVAQRDAPAKPNNTGLPDNLKSGVESLSGMSMDNVKVHYNSSQPAQLNALAYAQGTDIHVAPGQEKHLPHEAWHVVQQAQGRVRPTMQMKAGVPVNDDKSLEHEADVMGAKAVSVGVVQGKSIASAPNDTAAPVVQCRGDMELFDDFRHLCISEGYVAGAAFLYSNGDTEFTDNNLVTANLLIKEFPLCGEFAASNIGLGSFIGNICSALYKLYPDNVPAGEEFAEAGTEDHGYDVQSEPTEYDGSTALDAVQLKRNPGLSGPKSYGSFTNMLFEKTTPNATIDFDAGLKKSSSKQNNKPNSLFDLNTMITGGKVNSTIFDPHKNKNVSCPRAGQTFDKSDRDQHFAIADMLYYITHGSKPNRTGTWTWHHLETPYQMVLVNMQVHAKHGHNGGVYVW